MNGLLWTSVAVLALVHTVLIAAQWALVAAVPSRLNDRIGDRSNSVRRLADDAHTTILCLQTSAAIVVVATGAAAASASTSLWEFVVALAVLLGLTAAARTVALRAPEPAFVRLAPVVAQVVALVRPISTALAAIGRRRRRDLTVDESELGTVIEESREGGLIDDEDHALLTAALSVDTLTAAEVMIPLSDVITIERSTTVEAAEAEMVRSGHSRLLIVGRGTDDVLGFVHAKDLLALPAQRRDRPVPFDVIRMILTATPSTSLSDVLAAMRRARRHVVVIADSDHHTVGMVTMEDILEQIVGDIVDESDRAATPGADGAP